MMDRAASKRLLRMLGLTLLGVAIVLFMASLDEIFAPLLLALLLAYILNPVVNQIQKMRIPRAPAIGVLFLLIYGFFVGFLFLTVPTFIQEMKGLYVGCRGDLANPEGIEAEESVPLDPPWKGVVQSYVDLNGNGRYDPGYVRVVAVWLADLKHRIQRERPGALEQGLDALQRRMFELGTGVFDTALTAVRDVVLSVLGFLTVFILIPIYLFYFLMGLSGMRDRVFENLPGLYRSRIIRILTEIDEAVSAFFRGRLIIMLIKGILIAIGLMILGVPFALVIGLVTAVASLIPIAGFLMGMVPGVAIALLDAQSVGLAALVLALFVVVEVLENYFLTPWILKERVHLHPITLVVSVFVGEELFGFVGMLLAIPMTSVLKILFKEFVFPQIHALAEEKAAEEEPGL
jgi:predicted PurR-regulated permease PerM